jgi:four helix bundle protein
MKRNGVRYDPRVEEEQDVDFGEEVKGRTSNVQRPTPNSQRKTRAKRSGRVRGEPNEDFGEGLNGRTPNAQRPTPNSQLKERDGADGKKYDLEDRLLDYAARIVRLVDALPPTSAGKHLADQLLRSGTSSLGNHGELQGAESRKDFIHKLRVCLKEIEESWRWLRLIHRVPMLAPSKVEPLLAETKALMKIFSASVRTAEKNKG